MVLQLVFEQLDSCIKELKAENDDLKAEMAKLKRTINELKGRSKQGN